VDLFISSMILVFFGPILLLLLFMVWVQDFRSPLYIALRVGRGGASFKMFKLRTMVINADRSGVDSTSASDPRITSIGAFIRKWKLDELAQFMNVFLGQMSLVGPRPNVTREVAIYTKQERGLLSVKPGITDFSSIVFSDEGEVLKNSQDPDLDYNQLIRPWKSRLSLFYIEKASLGLDFKLIYLTALAIVSRRAALEGVTKLLTDLDADPTLVSVATRHLPLIPTPPPGATDIVLSRA
jgi:lipopolysaccharide/colanic/teichoic acid biosynthesis glycosyltransferase